VTTRTTTGTTASAGLGGAARWWRDPFAVAAGALAAVAFAGSFEHTRSTIVEHGQTGWIATATALMPEASVLLGVLRIRRGGRPAQVRWAWLVLVASAAFTIAANLAQAEPSLWGYVVAGWPAWAAIGAAGFIEMSGGGDAGDRKGRERPWKAQRSTTHTTAPASAGQGVAAPASGGRGAGGGVPLPAPLLPAAGPSTSAGPKVTPSGSPSGAPLTGGRGERTTSAGGVVPPGLSLARPSSEQTWQDVADELAAAGRVTRRQVREVCQQRGVPVAGTTAVQDYVNELNRRAA
jgi:hypothetical protein